MAPDDLFTRDEVLGGLPARRAAAALFLVESRAAYLADRSRRATDFLISEEAEERRDLAFLEAFSGGREPPVKPDIQDLEQFAPRWASLVPANPSVRATVAHMLGRKYRFTSATVPRLRTALGLDDEAVARAYRRQYGHEISAIYAVRAGPLGRLRAAWSALSARIDALSPFWLAFALTVAFSFSQAVLALPTGVASMGAGPGALLVIGVGLVNVLTMACMAEACARNGDFRYGRAFLGRLITGYLGAEASLIFSIVAALRTFLVTLAGSIGIGLTLAASTGVRAELWIAGLAAVEVYYLSRRSLSVTITTMLSLLGLNLGLFLLIMLFALGAIDPANLAHAAASVSTGAALDFSVLRLVVGVVVMLYIGHVYVIQCAKIVLPRDPSARSLIRGSVAGTATLIVLFTTWMLAVNGAVSADRLIGEAGTSLPLLAERIGPAVNVLGSLLVVVLLGMSCLRTTTILFNLVQERLPSRLRVTVTLPRRRETVLFEPRRAGGARLGVRYLGLSEGHARLEVRVQHGGAVERVDVVVADTWDAGGVLARPGAAVPRAGTLTLDVVEAQPDALRVRVTTTMRVRMTGDWSPTGPSLAAVTELPAPLRALMAWLTRRGEATLAEIARQPAGPPERVDAILGALVTEGFVERIGEGPDSRYRVRLAPRRSRPLPPDVWAALGEPPPADVARPGRRTRARLLAARELLMSEVGQFVVSVSPVLGVLLVAEAMLLVGSASFAGVLGFGGVIANSLTAGVYPVLLLVASRRKGDYEPGTVYRVIGHPLFVTTIYALSVANLFVHGLVIYRDPWARACALVFGAIVLVVTVRMIRAGAFSARAVVELREDAREGGRGMLTVMSDGRPLAAEMTLSLPEGERTSRASAVAIPALSKLQAASVRLPAARARELKVWVHRVTADGASEAVPARVEIRRGSETEHHDLTLSGGQAVSRLTGAECSVGITLEHVRREDPGQITGAP
jgi:hypothetical protein